MRPIKTKSGALRSGPSGDLRDPEYRRSYIFGEEEPNPRSRGTLLADFLLFGALMQR